ncbi:transporter substrate-binding domain-containing protein [Chitinivorax sp. B]|uniref:substrate-binding periplasmic protein n=1 Tax=Chitinivorax sp. B TaxID=2502235 RepID=UPI001484F89D|nr:transporter substrate-binding domain-containing protein [Chitinivorax sp. B]
MVASSVAYGGELSAGTTLKICDDSQEWPPFTYAVRDANGERTQQLAGYSIDVLHAILDKAKIRFEVKLLPWSRCLAEAKLGRNYQLLQNVSNSTERARDYWVTRPYYWLTSHYFYSLRRFPEGLKVDTLEQIRQFKVCGIRGYNYEHYGYPAGTMDQDAGNFQTVIKRLHLRSCDVFFEKIEVMEGFKAVGIDYFSDPELASAPVPGMEPTPFHFLISRGYPQGKALMNLLDDGIQNLEKSGRLQRLWRATFPNSSQPR